MHATCDGSDVQSSFISDFGVTMDKLGRARLHIDAPVVGILKCEVEWNRRDTPSWNVAGRHEFHWAVVLTMICSVESFWYVMTFNSGPSLWLETSLSSISQGTLVRSLHGSEV